MIHSAKVANLCHSNEQNQVTRAYFFKMEQKEVDLILGRNIVFFGQTNPILFIYSFFLYICSG